MRIQFEDKIIVLELSSSCDVLTFIKHLRKTLEIKKESIQIFKNGKPLNSNDTINMDDKSIFHVVPRSTKVIRTYSDTSIYNENSRETNVSAMSDKIKHCTGATKPIQMSTGSSRAANLEAIMQQLSSGNLGNDPNALSSLFGMLQAQGINVPNQEANQEPEPDSEEEEIEPDEDLVTQLVGMGFAEDRARRVLVYNHNNLEASVTMMIDEQDLALIN